MGRDAFIDRREYVKLWTKAYKEHRNYDWLAKELGVTKQAVMQRGDYLRGRGVKLPQLRTHLTPTEVDKLNKIIEKELEGI